MKSTYTDASSCRSVDFQPDEFAHFCRGPAGMAAVLYYADGRAAATFGPAAKGKRDEVRDGAGGETEPLGVGPTGKPYGDKIEWVPVGGGARCAAIVRMNLEAGSRLVVIHGFQPIETEAVSSDLSRLRRKLVELRSDYAIMLDAIASHLDASDEGERDALRGLLRVGLHEDVEVTDGHMPGQIVSQIFCSALPVAYSGLPQARWAPFARLCP